MTQLRNGLVLALLLIIGIRIAAELLRPVVVPVMLLLGLVVVMELLVGRHRRWK